jgi:hypothetical protein
MYTRVIRVFSSGRSVAPAQKRSAAAVDPGRILAALIGAPIVAWLAGTWSIACLPVPVAWSFLIGSHMVVPLWVALACTLPLARSARAAWTYCALPSLAFGAMILLWGGA